jgi:hypothetical protein
MPFRNEAVTRLKNGTLGLSVLLLVTLIWPLPSLPYSLYVIIHHIMGQSVSSPQLVHWAESLVAFVFLTNITQSAVALRFPPKPVATKQNPAKPTSTPTKSQSSGRLTDWSSNRSNSPNVSFMGSYDTENLIYTPSKQLSQQSLPLSRRAAASPSPSPVISAYRGRLGNSASGRALDGSFLGQISASESDQED